MRGDKVNATYISSKAEKHEDELPSVFCDADFLNMSNVDLCRLIQAGNKKAIDAIYKKNIKLIKKCADKYKDFCGNSIDTEDLIASGAIGLIEAAKKFDCNADVKFSTYAFPWIKKYIFEELNANASTIRIPSKVTIIMRKIKEEQNRPLEERPTSIYHIEYEPKLIVRRTTGYAKTNREGQKS